jgi:hypothetical protein
MWVEIKNQRERNSLRNDRSLFQISSRQLTVSSLLTFVSVTLDSVITECEQNDFTSLPSDKVM